MNPFSRGISFLKNNPRKTFTLSLLIVLALVVIDFGAITIGNSWHLHNTLNKSPQVYRAYGILDHGNKKDTKFIKDNIQAKNLSQVYYTSINGYNFKDFKYPLKTDPNLLDVWPAIYYSDNYRNAPFVNGIKSSVTQKELNQSSDGIVISQQWSDANNWHVGDKISIPIETYNFGIDEKGGGSGYSEQVLNDIEFNPTFTVIGTYSIQPTDGQQDLIKQLFYRRHSPTQEFDLERCINSLSSNVFASTKVLDQLTKQLGQLAGTPNITRPTGTSFIKVADKQSLTALKENYKSTYGEKLYSTIVLPDEFTQYKQSIYLVAAIIFYSIIVCSVIGLLTTIAIIVYINERRFEFGIYRALGASRFNIGVQLIAEFTFLVGGLTIILYPLADYFATRLISTATKVETSFSLSFEVVILLLIIDFIFIFGSTIIPLLYTLRLNPKKILL